MKIFRGKFWMLFLPLDVSILLRLKDGSESEDLIWYVEEENLFAEGLLRRG